MMLNRAISLIPADDPDEPDKNYYNSSTGHVLYDANEQAFRRVGSGVAYSAQTIRDGTSSRLYVATYPIKVTYIVDYKNAGTNYGLRFYVNDKRITDIHGTADNTWHTYSYTVDLEAGDYIRIVYYSNIYWRNQRLMA